MRKIKTLLLHLLVLLALLALAGAIATWRGGLFPFDPRYTALVTGGGLAMLAMGWGLIWLVPVLLSALLARAGLRLLLWPLALVAMVALHAWLGSERGFLPISELGGWAGALLLYAVPVALAVVIGSAIGEILRPTLGPNKKTPG